MPSAESFLVTRTMQALEVLAFRRLLVAAGHRIGLAVVSTDHDYTMRSCRA